MFLKIYVLNYFPLVTTHPRTALIITRRIVPVYLELTKKLIICEPAVPLPEVIILSGWNTGLNTCIATIINIIIKIIMTAHANLLVIILSISFVENAAKNKTKNTIISKTTNQGIMFLTYNSIEEKLMKIIAIIKLTKKFKKLLSPKIFVLFKIK